VEQRAPGDLAVAHQADDAANVVDVALAEVGELAFAHGIELAPEAVGIAEQ
jgi:hypothetical protein